MKRHIFILLSIISGLLIACSADYDYSPNINTEDLSFITLSSSANEGTIGVNQEVKFMVTSDNSLDNNDITSIATIYINNEPIQQDKYTFNQNGTYLIEAKIDNITSNQLNIKVANGDYYITTSPEEAIIGQEVTFNLYNNAGENLTETATFTVNNSSISSNKYTSTENGTHQINTTINNNVVSASFNVFTPKRKIALEDYTGDWCGWCPRVLLVVDQVYELTDDVVVLAIHKNDDMEASITDHLITSFNVGAALPKLRANRTENISVIQDSSIPEAVNYITNIAGTETNTAIQIETKLSGDNLKVTTELISTETLPNSYKLAVYLYQDGLIYDQANYYNTLEGNPWYNQGNPIENFTHNHVLETNITENSLGDNIETTPAFTSYTKEFPPINLANFAHTDNGNTYDPSRFGVAVFLVDENNNALNAQSVKAGKKVEFKQ